MKKTSIASVLVFVLLVAFASVAIAQKAEKDWEKTVTLPSGEVILDMSGEWDVVCEYYGRCSGLKPHYDILTITQEGNTFTAVKQIGSQWVPKGEETIKGELDKDGFKEVQAYSAGMGWTPCMWEISENGNKIVIEDGRCASATLTRR